MIKVGLTGGLASGKSTVGRIFRELGASVFDADRIVHDLQQPGNPVLNEIIDAFGQQFRLPDGGLDRRRLAEHVFKDADALRRLEAITHPAVFAEIERRFRHLELEGTVKVALVEAARIAEGGSRDPMFDYIILVTCPVAIRRRRALDSGKFSTEDIERRLERQTPDAQKLPLADFLIDTGGNLDQTRKQVQHVWDRLLDAAARHTHP